MTALWARKASALLAAPLCRLYAVLPPLMVAILAAPLMLAPRPGLTALVLTAVCLVLHLAWIRGAAGRTGTLLLSGALFAAAISLPALLLPPMAPWLALPAGFMGGTVLTALLVWGVPRVPWLATRVELTAFPDIVTSVVLVVLFGVPVAILRRGAPPADATGPLPLTIVVAAHEEEGTVGRAVESLRREGEAALADGVISHLRVLLADSGSTDGTRKRALEAGADEVIAAPPGKLSAREAAIATVEEGIVLSADGDRVYLPGVVHALVRPIVSGAAKATNGETQDVPGVPPGSALTRAILGVPLNAGCSAAHLEVHRAVPLNTAVDQFRHRTVWTEEEFRFGVALQQVGPVAYVPEAVSVELRPYPMGDRIARHLFGRRLRTF